MQLKDAKLGDKVRLYLDEFGFIVNGSKYSNKTIIATVIAIGLFDYNSILIGWKKSDKHPHDSYTREGKDDDMVYVDNENQYPRGKILSYWIHVELVEEKVNEAPTLSSLKDNEEWKMFRNYHPNECVCGIPKGNCEYHPI